jgi:predicted  nucleic acid-binding Zn-ribbon protein
LKEFADANLKPLCSVDNIDLCEPEKKELIEKYLKMSEEELVALVESEETKINDLQADFEEEIEKLQEKYEGFQDEMDAAVNEVKNSGLSMMKAIMKTKTAPLKGEL